MIGQALRPRRRKSRARVHDALVGIAANEAANRASLEAARASGEFQVAFSEADPLVTVTIATVGRPALLGRALPSVLAQTHRNLEVIVVGDGCEPGLAARIAALGDMRVTYIDAGPRQPVFDDPEKLWHTAATRARNLANSRATGRWVLEFDDDDAMRPGCVEALLALVSESRAEAVYGRVQRVGAKGGPPTLGSFPPRRGHFSWAAGMYHAHLGFFGREHLASDLGLPGDWWLAERMLRAGVRFAMTEEILADIHPAGPGNA